MLQAHNWWQKSKATLKFRVITKKRNNFKVGQRFRYVDLELILEDQLSENVQS